MVSVQKSIEEMQNTSTSTIMFVIAACLSLCSLRLLSSLCQFLYSSSTPFACRRARPARHPLELQGVTSVQEAEQPKRDLVVNARFDVIIYDERISFILDLPKSLALAVRETPFVLFKTNLSLFFVLKNTNIMPCVGNARKYNTPAYSTLPTGSSGQTSAESGLVHSKGTVRHLSGFTGLMR